MLKLQPDPTFTAPVEISVPGQALPKTVRFVFRYMDRDAYAAWLDSLPRKFALDADGNQVLDAGGQPVVERPARKDEDSIPEIVAGWDRADIDVEFSVEALKALLRNYPAAAGEIFDAHRREMLESKRKN